MASVTRGCEEVCEAVGEDARIGEGSGGDVAGEPDDERVRDVTTEMPIRVGSSASGRSPLAHLLVTLALPVLFVSGLAQAALGQSGPAGAHLAYIDPGAGSFVVQALVAALAGVAVALRVYWSKVKALLGLSVEAEDDDESPPDGA